MKYIPVFIDFRDKKVLFIGGGKVAARKFMLFRGSGAAVTVIAPKVDESIISSGEAVIINRSVLPEDISPDHFMVYAVTDCKEVNASVAAKCKKLGILCNRCDSAEGSTFINGAVLSQGPITAAIESEGVPSVSQAVKESLKQIMTPELGEAAKIAAELRAECKVLPEKPCRKSEDRQCIIKKITSELLSEEYLARIKKGEGPQIKTEMEKCLF